MTCANMPPDARTFHPCLAVLALACACTAFAGCSTPSAVVPLLAVSDRALADESAQLETDAQRAADQLGQSRQSLADAYDRDLTEAAALDVQWVRQATAVYVAAREALLRHEAELRRQYDIRRDNLAVGREALARARLLLEQRDAALDRITRKLNLEAVLQSGTIND